jgi:amidase
VSTFITRFETSGSGVRLAVKDLIDMAGVPTTAGCRAVADEATPAAADAACLAGARASGARIVGRTNLHELALGVTGENPWFGTPVNPLDPRLVPGGSSSGSAVAVATGEADVAFGSDTGGSVRIPSACCGTAGLKTTHGRISLEGVWPLAPSFDTVGPMARDVAGLARGMALLEPGFTPAAGRSFRVGRLRLEADDRIDAAVDEALRRAELEVREVELPEWAEASAAAGVLLVAEAWATDRALLERAEDRIGADVVARLRLGAAVDEATRRRARETAGRWRARLDQLFTEIDALAMPTLTIFPPPLGRGEDILMARCTLPANLAGVPALAIPVPSGGHLPASLQLMGPRWGEDMLLAVGALIEAATR